MISDTHLNTIRNSIDRELQRSIAKHGMWENLNHIQMFDKIADETEEVYEAICENDHHGAHGTFNELAQVAACCVKMMNQIIIRESANETITGNQTEARPGLEDDRG